MKEPMKTYRTSDGAIPLTKASFGESGVHLSRGVLEWSESSERADRQLEAAIRKHDRRTKARHEYDLKGRPGTEITTSTDPSGAHDTLHIITEFGRSGVGFTYAVFSSEV